MILKDVLIKGLNDEEIKQEVLDCEDIDAKTVEETLSFIEEKEMERDARVAEGKSSKKSNRRAAKEASKTKCQYCETRMIEPFRLLTNLDPLIKCENCVYNII